MGWFNGLTGFAALPANLVGGWLWSAAGPSATFVFGAWVAAISVALTIAWLPWLRGKRALRDVVIEAEPAQSQADAQAQTQ
jgi:uncharacterized membrane protein AbrB (regulator of aidB expression)